MIRHFAILDAAGLVVAAGTVPEGEDLPEGAVACDPHVGEGWWCDGGEWRERPALPEPDGLSWSGLPAGTVIEVRDAEIGVLLAQIEPEDGAATIGLPDPGAYEVIVRPPPPWRVQRTEWRTE